MRLDKDGNIIGVQSFIQHLNDRLELTEGGFLCYQKTQTSSSLKVASNNKRRDEFICIWGNQKRLEEPTTEKVTMSKTTKYHE